MNGVILSCIVTSLRTLKDGSVSICLETMELSAGHAGELFSLHNKVAAVYISPKEIINQKEIDQVDKVDPEILGKTQSQRIRGVLYKLFEQDHEGHSNFDMYYKAKTELIIDHLKSKIR